MKIIIAFIGIFFLMAGIVYGQSKEELQIQKQRAYDDLKLTKELMEKTSARRSNSVKQLSLLQNGINARARLISALESELGMLSKKIQETEGIIAQLSIDNKKNREEYARLIYYAYRNHTDYEKLMYILAGATISQSYQRYKYLKYISDYRKQKAEEIEAFMEELDIKNRQLNELMKEKIQALEEKEEEQGKLVVQRGQEADLVNDLKTKEAQLRKEVQEKERIARELESRIREIIEEEARKSSGANAYATLTPEQELVGDDFRNNKGKLPWPVEQGIITVGFGNHELPGLRGSSVKNNGVDITSTPGTMVRAVFEGEVTKVFAILGANYTVLIRHGVFLSVYQNLVNVRVKTGDKVLTKEALGEAFTDEDENVAFVHFEVWQERTILNPAEWISK
ncbi:MAG: peptidoglycan DD-metalloendopeptidase family protein [Bacteroidales bacterium]|nr:peptidoglycan DD-metalloendopeptidase family protein [Bacteroidales bacterium]